MGLVVVVAAWVLLSLLAGKIAGDKGHDDLTYFFIALLLSPVVGILAAAVARPKKAAVEKERLASGTEKKCPHCAELIKVEANVCRFCGRDVAPAPSLPPTSVHDVRSRAEYETWRDAKGKKA